jgi:hypothetical protein
MARLLYTRCLLLVGLVTAAGLSTPSCSAGGGGAKRTGRNAVSGGPGATTGGSKSGSKGNNASNDDGTDGDEAAGGDGLPAYLFTLDGARKLKPLVRPLERATESDLPDNDASKNELRDLISDVLNDTMKLPVMSPGRNFNVRVARDNNVNAQALNENVVVNTGILNFAPPLSIAMVICHEVAHSTRNHSKEFETAVQGYDSGHGAAKAKYEAAMSDFLKNNYTESGKQLVVSQADYDKIKPLFDAYWGDLDITSRRIESEADIVGGQICANMGFTKDQVVQGFKDLFAQFQAHGATASFQPGAYTVDSKDDLPETLDEVFGRKSHPTDDERSEQVERVGDVFQGESAKDEIAQRWLKEYPDAAGIVSADSQAFALHDDGAAGHGEVRLDCSPIEAARRASLDALVRKTLGAGADDETAAGE